MAPAGLSHLEILQRITLGVLCVAGIYGYAIILIPKSWLSEELQAYHYPVLTQEEKLNRQYAGVLLFCRICDRNAWIVHDFSDFLRASNPENLLLYAVFWASIICAPLVVLGYFRPCWLALYRSAPRAKEDYLPEEWEKLSLRDRNFSQVESTRRTSVISSRKEALNQVLGRFCNCLWSLWLPASIIILTWYH